MSNICSFLVVTAPSNRVLPHHPNLGRRLFLSDLPTGPEPGVIRPLKSLYFSESADDSPSPRGRGPG
jgi:hypothetical protein